VKHSLRQGAGYLVVDHTNSPGVSAADVLGRPGMLAAPGGTTFERDVVTCSHCERAVVLEPLRTRDRGYCPTCDHYVCDACEALRVRVGCVPFRQTVDRLQNAALQGHPLASIADLPRRPFRLAAAASAHHARLTTLMRRGQAHYDAEEWDEAEPYFRELETAGILPGEIAIALGTICLYQGKRAEALAYAERAVQLLPDAQETLDNLVMYVDADPATTPAEAWRVRQRWWDACGAPVYATRQPHTNDRDPDRPLRVGYVSGDFCHHSAATVFGPFALAHTPAVAPYFYSSTDRTHWDASTQLFAALPGWRDIFGWADDRVADLMRRDQIDLLVDCSGYTANNRLRVFARKVAPIQITGWGYATGVSWPVGLMDYLIADPVVIPPRHDDLTEAVALLPCAVPYFQSETYPPAPSPLPCLTAPPTFGVFQRALKLNDACVDAWRQILERLPESRLILKGDYCRTLVERLQARLAPVLDRVSILNVPTTKADHLAMWAHIDVALDPWPQSGGVASCEALWRGVPIVTYQGDRLMSRVASALLTPLGLTDYIADSPAQYVACAVQAITNRTRLAEVRQTLPTRYAAWLTAADYLQAVETFYRTAWRRWCALES
jgi:predicted O-linked N-acetylglucosamine transferase (SPINDLY family)